MSLYISYSDCDLRLFYKLKINQLQTGSTQGSSPLCFISLTKDLFTDWDFMALKAYCAFKSMLQLKSWN